MNEIRPTIKERIFYLRERVSPYGFFEIHFLSGPNIFLTKYYFGKEPKKSEHIKLTEFIKSDLEDCLNELEVCLDLYLKKYIPNYIR